MVHNFGSGLYLDEQLDFAVGTTGDLKSTEGLEELKKDLATQMIAALDQYIGQPPSGNLQAKVADTAKRIVELDSRVNAVQSESISVEFSESRDELTVRMTVNTSDGEQDLVFNI